MGPLKGIRVVELGGIGPSPMACMLLADLGADVVRIDRTESADLGGKRPAKFNLLLRGRRIVALDLKNEDAVAQVLDLVASADVLIEGFRPGVTERMGLGPDDCFAVNPRLIYGRMTGWGQEGPMSQIAGHDSNYTALAGALEPTWATGCRLRRGHSRGESAPKRGPHEDRFRWHPGIRDDCRTWRLQ